jgi:dynein assembly factor 1
VALDNLNLKGNRIGQTKDSCIDSIKGLLDCPSITSLDISQNYLKDPALVDEVLVKMPNLKVLYCQGNKFVKEMPSYRKAMIVKLKNLMYLDDKPVFPEDRRRAEAYMKGGWDDERAMMKIIKKEKEDEYNANHEAFRLMIDDVKKQKAQE